MIVVLVLNIIQSNITFRRALSNVIMDEQSYLWSRMWFRIMEDRIWYKLGEIRKGTPVKNFLQYNTLYKDIPWFILQQDDMHSHIKNVSDFF